MDYGRYETLRLAFQNPTWLVHVDEWITLAAETSNWIDGTGTGSPAAYARVNSDGTGMNLRTVAPGHLGVIRPGWGQTGGVTTPKLTNSGTRLDLDSTSYSVQGGSGTLQYAMNKKTTATLRSKYVV
jgi:hypothetical protein|tara:strand:+ start:84 stop:464 length:381 start_codon:yes stop_codon:yes gene_type:complete